MIKVLVTVQGEEAEGSLITNLSEKSRLTKQKIRELCQMIGVAITPQTTMKIQCKGKKFAFCIG